MIRRFLFSSVRVGIMLVKIDDTVTATEYGVEDTPALVYFENEVPHLYEGMQSSDIMIICQHIKVLKTSNSISK